MKPLRVLVGCEVSGRVRDAFLRRGHDAVSCDILPTTAPGPHLQGDLCEFLGLGWDLLIAHPPCRYLASSGLHWQRRRPERAQETEQALAFVRRLMECPIPRWAIENPRGAIGSRIRPADQRIQPHQFGEDASKETRLWLRGLPKLRPTAWRPGRLVDDGRPQLGLFGTGVERWDNQTDGGQNALPETRDRAARRAVTYHGIAEAMAEQWGEMLKGKKR